MNSYCQGLIAGAIAAPGLLLLGWWLWYRSDRQQSRLEMQVPSDLGERLRDLKWDDGIGHYVILPAMPLTVEDEIRDQINDCRLNVRVSGVATPEGSSRLWCFGKDRDAKSVHDALVTCDLTRIAKTQQSGSS